jgi:hypothetical protein
MPIRYSCVRSSQRTSVTKAAVPSIKPTLSAEAQLLFSVAGEGIARLDTGDKTTSASTCSTSTSQPPVLAWFVPLSFLYQLMCRSSSSSCASQCAEAMHTSSPGSCRHHTHDLVDQGGPSTDFAHHTPSALPFLKILQMQSSPWCPQAIFLPLCCWTLSRQHGL